MWFWRSFWLSTRSMWKKWRSLNLGALSYMFMRSLCRIFWNVIFNLRRSETSHDVRNRPCQEWRHISEPQVTSNNLHLEALFLHSIPRNPSSMQSISLYCVVLSSWNVPAVSVFGLWHYLWLSASRMFRLSSLMPKLAHTCTEEETRLNINRQSLEKESEL